MPSRTRSLCTPKTIPGFTETSTFPLAAEAAGVSFEGLVETILDAALQTGAPAKL